jgi:hypothetical protein
MAETKPTPSVTPLEGKTSIDDKMFFEPERLSYESADDIATRIVAQITKQIKDKTVVIAGEHFLADLGNLHAAYVTLETLKNDYNAICTNSGTLVSNLSLMTVDSVTTITAAAAASLGAVSVIPAASTVLQATLGIASLLREDVEYHGAHVQIDSLSFEIALASRVTEHASRGLVPALFVLTAPVTDEGSLVSRLREVQKAKERAWKVVGPVVAELVRLEADLDRAVREADKGNADQLSAQVLGLRRDLQPLSDPLARADQRLSDLQTRWNEPATEGGTATLATLLRAEAIQQLQPIYLHAKIVNGGGHHRISRSLLRTLFVGDGLRFSGGAIARWAMIDKQGFVTRGGICVARRGDSSRNSAQTSTTSFGE